MSAIVHIRQIGQRVGGVALSGMDLDVEPGESLALVGARRSGRTTLLQTLAALRPPASGRVWIAGFDTVQSPFDARAHAMYVGAALPGPTGLRVGEYLEFVRHARRGRERRSADATIAHALERAALSADANIESLAPAARSRLALSSALVVMPRLLLLDDPFAGFDDETRTRFAAWIAEARATGTAVIAAVNEHTDSEYLGAAALWMERGGIISGIAATSAVHASVSLATTTAGVA